MIDFNEIPWWGWLLIVAVFKKELQSIITSIIGILLFVVLFLAMPFLTLGHIVYEKFKND